MQKGYAINHVYMCTYMVAKSCLFSTFPVKHCIERCSDQFYRECDGWLPVHPRSSANLDYSDPSYPDTDVPQYFYTLK